MGNITNMLSINLGSVADTSFQTCQVDKINGCLTCPACTRQQQRAGKLKKINHVDDATEAQKIDIENAGVENT